MNDDRTKTILREARALIATPERWSQGAYRRNGGSKILDGSALDSAVKSRCAGGAIIDSTCAGDVEYREVSAFLLTAIALKTGDRYLYVSSWNDNRCRTHAEVLQAFGWAIDD